ncbi:FUSC family protein [Tistrella mobilis]
MSTDHRPQPVFAAAGRRLRRFCHAPGTRADAEALLFSAKSFAAAMLAWYIAASIGLPRPYWAVLTVYIVSQTSAGASAGRGVYRFVGTLVGAAATVVIIPAFVNDPILCSIVLAGWIGLCLALSALDRTPRAYAFVLAGYTASLIGFPGVLDPGQIFTTALVRVQEISIGILCAVLVHRLVLPKHVTDQFIGRLAVTLQDARRLAGDALGGAGDRRMQDDRRQLAADLLGLQGLGTQLPYDPAPRPPHAALRRMIHDRLARLLPLTMEVEDRIEALGLVEKIEALGLVEKIEGLGNDRPEDGITRLVADLRSWIATGDVAAREEAAAGLIDRARSLGARLAAGAVTPHDRLAANLAGHLADMIGLLHDCDRLWREVSGGAGPRAGAASPRPARGYVYHRDPWMAVRAGAGAAIGVTIGCLFWIWSGWPDGGMAVSILGACCALFGNLDAPAPPLRTYMRGSVYGVVISLVYGFVILPRVPDFTLLVVVLAPVFLFAGSLQARPPTTFLALGITLTVPILGGLDTGYGGDFAAALNNVVALFAATGFAVVSMTIFQTVPVHAAINRLLRLSRRDVTRRILGAAPDEAYWTNLMIDRTALLLPRLRLSGAPRPDILDDTLHHLRIGHAAGLLRHEICRVEGHIGRDVRGLLSAIALDVGARRPDPARLEGLEARIGALTGLIAGSSLHNRARLLDLVIDLGFALGLKGTTGGEPGA